MTDYDQALVWSTLLLLSIGLIMIYSASIAIAEAQFGADRATTTYCAIGLPGSRVIIGFHYFSSAYADMAANTSICSWPAHSTAGIRARFPVSDMRSTAVNDGFRSMW
jgi:hypothetical protein